MSQEREENLQRFISNEVYLCQTALIEELLKHEVFTYEDIQNLYRPFDGNLIAPKECYGCSREDEYLDSETGQCKNCFEDCQEAQEIYEWWAVSPWMADQLQKHNEPVIDNGFGKWWGRTTTGQAISLDYIINVMYDDLMVYQ